MIKSMTGYGIASVDSDGTKYTVEIKSLNSKFLELSLRLPKTFAEKEFQLRNDCSKQIITACIGPARSCKIRRGNSIRRRMEDCRKSLPASISCISAIQKR